MQGGNVDRVANREVHGGVDHVPQGRLVVLNGASLAITVA